MTAPSPAQTSVYRYYDRHDILIYVGITNRGMRRQSEHNADKEWWSLVDRQDVEHYPTRPEALAREKDLITRHLPPFNKQHNGAAEAVLAAYLAFKDLAGDDPMRWRDAVRAMQQRIELDPHGVSESGHVILRTRLIDMHVVSVLGLPADSGKPAHIFGLRSSTNTVRRIERVGPLALIHLSTTTTHPLLDAYGTVKFDGKQQGLVLRNVHVRLDHDDPRMCTKICRRSNKNTPKDKPEIRWVRADSEGRSAS